MKIIYFTHELTYVKLLLRLRLCIVASRTGIDGGCGGFPHTDLFAHERSMSPRGHDNRRYDGSTSLARALVSTYGDAAQSASIRHTLTDPIRSAITVSLSRVSATKLPFLRRAARGASLAISCVHHICRWLCVVGLSAGVILASLALLI